jgi:excinuclease ABC subunit B
VLKEVSDIMEGARSGKGRRDGDRRRVAEEQADYSVMSPDEAVREIKSLESRMYEHARNLEFEEAARMRDEIERIKVAGLMT